MIIDLTKIDSYVINLDQEVQRFKRVSEVLSSKNIKFKKHKGFNVKESDIQNIKPVEGCAISHLQLISSLKTPFIVFEDDVETTEHWKSIIEVPDDTDAIHLGASIWGYVRNHFTRSYAGVVLVTQHTNEFKKAHNMCSTHGILYLTDKFRLSMISCIKEALYNQIPFDLNLARIQKDFNYLIPNKPFIYQKYIPEHTNVELII